MFESSHAPWASLTPGCYVWDATGTPWRLDDEHPDQVGTFLAVNARGDRAVLSDPGKPVRAMLTGGAANIEAILATFDGTTVSRLHHHTKEKA